MTDIERRFFECPEHGKTPVSARDTAIVPDCCPEREAVEVVYVPASQLQGAVERIKGLRLAVNPKDSDEREAAYARGYLAAVSDALETLYEAARQITASGGQ